MPATPLTDAQDAEAYALRNTGLTERQVAERLGENVTRAQIHAGIARHAARIGAPDPSRRRSARTAEAYARRAGITFDAAAIAEAIVTPTASTVIPTRTFGVEIEFRRPARNTNLDPEIIAEALRDAGLDARAENYNHTTRPHWKLIHDASSDRELVSPVLSGTEGLRQVRVAMKVLRDLGCRVTKTEGMHVHVYAGDTTPTTVAEVFAFYAARQVSTFDQLTPTSRRNAYFCRSVNAQDAVRTMEFARRGSVGAVNGRYVTCNLDAYGRQGTVEYRQHAGTLNGRKACDWIELLLAVTQFVIDGGTLADTTLAGTLGALVGARLLGRRSAERLVAKATGYGFTPGPVVAAEPTAAPAADEVVNAVILDADAPTAHAWNDCTCPICTQARTLASEGAAALVIA